MIAGYVDAKMISRIAEEYAKGPATSDFDH